MGMAKCRTLSFREDKGAVAIIVALLATLMFSCAAIAVDLGSAWARKRDVQKQVDIAALSVGYLLPMTASNAQAIADKIAESFNNPFNRVVGQNSVSGSQLLNGNLADGEISFQNADFTPCSDQCPQMRVLGPPSKVQFGLSSVIGVSSTNVQRVATVRMTSELPPASKTVPFWLPSGCGFGPSQADTTQGGVTTPTPTPTPTATPTTSATPIPVSPIGTHVLLGLPITPMPYLGTITISGYSVGGVSASYKKVTLRAFSPGFTSFVDFAAQTTGSGAVPTFTVSTEISSVPGNWTVYALAQKVNSMAYSATSLIIQVGNPLVPTPSPTATPSTTPTPPNVTVGCVGQDRGNFGQLDSPRIEGGTKQERLAKNIALGLDHTLVPYVFAPGQAEVKDCGSGATLLPGAQVDATSQPGNNCITGDTGNDGPKMMDGFIQGISGGTPGRLNVANGHTTCPDRSDSVISGITINNDNLSCYLRNGATLTDIAQSTGVTTDMLDQSVINSPRFVWLPVVYATDRAQKNFQPIRQFVPGFITDETQTTAATSTNGLDIVGNSIEVLHVFTFNRDALAPIEQSNSVTYAPNLGGGIVRLVQ